jgi:hypothetical protein
MAPVTHFDCRRQHVISRGGYTATAPAAKPAAGEPVKKVYYGGGVGITLGSYLRFSFSPLVGYPLTPKISIGARGTYEYIKDTRYSPDLTASNYGGSAFARYRFERLLYAHRVFLHELRVPAVQRQFDS